MKPSFQGLPEIGSAPPTHKRDYGNVLNLSSNELSHPEHSRLIERWLPTVRAAAVPRYPYYPELQARLASRLGRSSLETWLVAGADEGIRILAFALGRAYGRAVASWPNYRGYARYCALAGIPLARIDLESGPAALPGEPSLVVLTDPDPAMGTKLAAGTRAAWVDAAARGGHLLFADEAYVGFDGDDPFGAPWAPASLRSFSKCLGMAGLRLAALIVPPDLGDYLSRWSPSNTVSSAALDFLGFALDHEAELAAVRADIARVRDAVTSRARSELSRWEVAASHANFLAFLLPTAAEAARVVRELASHGILVKGFSAEEGDPRAVRMTVVDEGRMGEVVDLLVQLHGSPGDA